MEISVVTVFRDHARWLPGAYESLLAQSRLPDEWVLVSDHSADGTLELARAYAKRTPFPVQTLSLSGESGPWFARIRGFEAARFPVIAILDVDDRFLPPYLERQGALLAAHPEAVVAACDVEPYSETPALLSAVGRRFEAPVGLLHPPALLGRLLFDFNTIVSPSATLIRRAVLLDAVRTAPEIRGFEDQVYWGSLALSHPFVFQREALLRYCVRADSQSFTDSVDPRGEKVAAYLMYLLWRIDSLGPYVPRAAALRETVLAAAEEEILSRAETAVRAPAPFGWRAAFLRRLLGTSLPESLRPREAARMLGAILPGRSTRRRRAERILRLMST